MKFVVDFLFPPLLQVGKVTWNFINGNLLANVFGGILAGFILWFILEKRIKNVAVFENRLRLLKNLSGDVLYNEELADNLVKKEAKYFSKNEITFDNYKTRGIEEFIYQRPLELDNKFYKTLRKVLGCIEVDNRFLEQVRRGPYQEVNKKRLFRNAEVILKLSTVLLGQIASGEAKLMHSGKWF